MNNQPAHDIKKVISWALYDWANSAFATTVMAGFFPVFFKQYWSAGSAVESTFRLGAANSVASLVIVAAAPVLGAIADRGSAKKRFLLFFSFLGILMTGGLYFVSKGDWMTAACLYVLGTIGFSGGNIFYDALLVSVAGPKKVDFVSALGFSLGYLGGGLLFAFNVFMTLKPQLFGLANAAEAVRWSYLTVAVWWLLFSLPIMFVVTEQQEKNGGRLTLKTAAEGFLQLKQTFAEIRKLKVVVLFLLGYWLYIDALDTIVRMAVDYGLAIGFKTDGLMIALLITQFVGFPAAIAFGRIGEKLGAKTGILIGIGVYLVITVWAYFMQQQIEFYILAVGIGLVQGGVQSLSRSLYTRIIPQNKSAEFFGFYNMLGKFAAVIGPLLMGWVGVISGDPRMGILSLVLLFVAGAVLLSRVDVNEGMRMARELEQ